MTFLPLVMTPPPHRGASCEAKETWLCFALEITESMSDSLQRDPAQVGFTPVLPWFGDYRHLNHRGLVPQREMWVEICPAGGPAKIRDRTHRDEVVCVVGKIIAGATECR